MTNTSAGLLLFRRRPEGLEVLVAHPGGPLWAGKDDGVWSIPKGLIEEGEEPLDAAKREFQEETGLAPPSGPFTSLGVITLKSGKRVHGFAAEGELDPAALAPGTFEMSWPPRGGKREQFPEIDRVLWLTPEAAKKKLNPAQGELVDRLCASLEGSA